MSPETNLLQDLLRRARSRRQLLLTLRGVAISLGVIALLLLLLGWAAHRYRYNSTALMTLRVGALLTSLATIYFALVRPLFKRISDARLARLIEERTFGVEDRLVTAVEFANGNAKGISPALVDRLYRDANDVSATLDVRTVIRRSRLMMYSGAALASLLLFAGVLKWGPREISEGVAQLVTPTTLAASTNALSIKVKPGTARVPKGSDQDILATLVNFDSQTVTVFARPLGSSEDFVGQTMEPAKARSDFRFSIFNIQDSMEYFVESNSVRSEVYKLNVVDLPYVKQLDVTLNFPAFTNLPTKNIEDGGDIAALKGTSVTIVAKLSGKVRAARLVYPDGKKVEMKQQGGDFVGELTVTGDTSYYIELVSTDGEAYRGSNEYDVSVLVDQPPTISFDKPGRDKKATNLEEVFTQARAEDDYGVVSMDLHFSVNGGDEKKVNLQQLTRESARSLSGAYTFFLEEYGLKPGDFISYYAKARDASNESTSDIYFIEVKPFEMEYKQAQQQGGGGGGGGDQDQNALSRRQKDLIAAVFARETFEFTRSFACFLDHLLLLSLVTTRSTALHLLLTAALFLERCLLAASEFFQSTLGFALLLLRLLLLRTLDGLVLVLHLVELKIEETGEFLLFSLTTTTALAALLTKRDLHLTKDRVGGEQSLQRALLGRQRIFAFLFSQRRRRAFHLLRSLSQVLGHFGYLLLSVGTAETSSHAIEKLERVCAKFFLT